jgi:apolipoprotein N-acyltransferase
MTRLSLPCELHPQRPTFRRIASFMIGFEILTLLVGFWGWWSGLSFWSIMPGALLSGLVGGGFLSVGVYAIQTGCMQRMSTFYRFSDRPGQFIMDSIMVALAVMLSAAWPVGYSIQQLAKQKTNSEQGAHGNPH